MNAFYRAFAEQHLGDGNAELNRQMQQRYQGISHVATSVTGLAPSENNAMRLLTQTDEIIDAMLADIQAAQQTCALAFYIIEPQGKIQMLLGAVRDAAKRGVECTILADAVAAAYFWAANGKRSCAKRACGLCLRCLWACSKHFSRAAICATTAKF